MIIQIIQLLTISDKNSTRNTLNTHDINQGDQLQSKRYWLENRKPLGLSVYSYAISSEQKAEKKSDCVFSAAFSCIGYIRSVIPTTLKEVL